MWQVIDDPQAAAGRRRVIVVTTTEGAWVGYQGGAAYVTANVVAPAVGVPAAAAAPRGLQAIRAPMVGRIVQLPVAHGAICPRGAPLVVLEAMKMEYRVLAPAAGTVVDMHSTLGDLVDLDAVLMTFRCDGDG